MARTSNSPNPSQNLSNRTVKTIAGLAVVIAIAASIFLANDGSGGTIEITGRDGTLTVSSANQVVNEYATLGSDISAGNNVIQVTDINDLDNGTAIAEGDLLLIMQMQGASINVSNDERFGEITSYGSAGNYEFIFVMSVVGNEITCSSNFQNDYTTAGHTQVIRVPQYERVTIQSGGSLKAQAWDGSTGGVLAFTASDTVDIQAGGSITVSELGFRGGVRQNTNSMSQTVYYTNDSNLSGEKGESIVGTTTDYESAGYRYGRGAVANGGGGGNGHNAGGGGGSNGNSGTTWTGMGHMSTSITGYTAWQLDPGYTAIGDYTSSSGGGRGGYTYASKNKDALTTAPGHSSWSGDKRYSYGGYGGRWVESDPDEKLFLGGGGGAGHGNNNANGSGGNGGGLVFIIAKAVKGAGTIYANGEAGGNTRSGHNDAPGGGGAGGTVVIKANSVTGISIEADGGSGGNQFITSAESEGPGGGGGGGYIALPAGATASTSVDGGNGGTTTSASITEFPANGATNGAPGEVSSTIYIHYPAFGSTFPVEWLGVAGEWEGNDAVIQWVTASESNSDYFALERSTDGSTYEEINRTNAAGYSEEIRTYEIKDANAAGIGAGQYVYRLRQVDKDGQFEYSPSVELALETNQNTLSVNIYPNPATDHINMSWTGGQGAAVSWEIWTLQGQKLQKGYGSASTQGETRIDLGNLPSGRYILRAQEGTRGVARQVVVQ